MEPINPPENSEQRNIIDKLAEFVARNGPHFEMMTKSKQANNPKFNFLFGGEHYQYYQWRLEVERNSVKNDAFGPNGPPPPMPPQNMNPGQFFPGLPPPPQSLGPHPPPPFGRPPVPMLNQLPKHLHGEPPFPQPPHHPAHPFPPSSMPQPPTLSLPPPMFQQAPPPPPFSAAPNMPPSAQPPFNNWHFQPQPQPAAAPGAQIDQPVESNAPPALDSAVLEQIAKAREAIAESQKNLDAQCKVLLEEDKQARIDEMINKALDDELKRMCEDYNINLNEFDKILQPIIETCRKESIANGKSWIFNNCSTAEQYDAVSKHILKKVTRTECSFEAKLHLMYLINDLYNRCMRKCSDQLRDSINSIIVPAFTTTLLEADEEKKQKMNKLLKLWEMNQYLDNSLLDQLKSPRQSLDAYKTSLYTRFDEQIQAITNEQTAKYSQMSKQHSDFVKHQEAIIQQLQQTKPAYSSTNGPPQMAARPPFPPATSNSNVYLGPGPPGPMPGRPLLPPNHGLHPFPHNQPTPPQIPPGYPSPYSHQPGPGLPPHNFYSNPNVPTSGAPPFLPPISGGPHLAPMPPLGVLPGGPGAPHLSPHAQEGPPVEEVRPPYFDMPAGIMTQYIKLEDFDYKPINPNEVRIPPFAPPTDRLLKAIEAFYAPPSHEHPRNAEGWEKLGLYEFIKAKSKARQEYEERKAAENDGEDDEDDVIATQTSNGVSDKDNANKKNNRSPSPPKKRYKVFKEERDPSSSKPSTTNSNTNSNSSSSGKSGRRSRSASPRKERRNRSKRSRSKSRSRSHSRSKSPRTRSHRGRRSRSPVARSKQRSRTKSPPPPISFQPFGRFTATANPQIPLGESNKGHQLLKKMGWSGAGGLGANEHGIQNPISAGEVRDRQDQYRGIGTSLGASDPFESYRRNKGQAYIQRIKDARQ